MSERGFSWTGTQFKLHGIDATDSYQPGFSLIVPDMESLDDVVVRTETALFISEPAVSWHGSFLIAGTGAPLSSTNLPAPSARGLVRQPDRFNWFTRDRIEIGGSLTRWADLYAATAGEWASQTEPLAAHGTDQRSHLGFATARTRLLAGAANFFDVLYTGSHIALSSGGMPAGMEALSGNRMMPSFVLPGGFLNEPETDDFQFLQAGWTHVFHQHSGFGALELRYGDSAAHLDTKMPPVSESLVELFGGAVVGAPPLANFAARRHREIDAVWQPAPLSATAGRHQFVAGGTWESGEPRNRFTTPSDRNLITADGAPAFVAEFNTPVDSRETVHSLSASFADRIMWTPALSLDLGASADWSRGSLPAQSSPAGTYTPRRSFDAHSDLIVWNSLSPHAGFAWQVPHLRGLVLRGSYSRLYVPLAARYIDFENANALGGNLYRWLASNTNAAVQPVEQGSLLMRFGGPYSSISPALHRPYSDEFSVAAEFPFTHRSIATIHVFRRDEKERIAAINTGVPAQVFTPVAIADAGPDGIPGTFDDQLLNAYAQSPATFGQDRYLLTNPSGLRMLNAGFVAEIGTEWLGVTLHASFVAEKSYGPTNPGNAFYENDPDVVGALFTDPNSTIHAAGRIFMDRAFIGKLQAAYRLPRAWGGIDLASTTVYTDGLVFARQLLVTGLPQGPIVIATTVRGSPEGGNRAQFAIDWNVRASREFRLPVGRLVMMADLMNVTNAGQKLQENDLSGPSFNLRLPVAIQPPRFVRLGLRYEF